jgi:hypothetical protein
MVFSPASSGAKALEMAVITPPVAPDFVRNINANPLQGKTFLFLYCC